LAVAAISLGCPKNLVDTEVMLGLLRAAGYEIVSDPERADVLLVNTCCFIAAARDESAETLKEAASLRRTGRVRALVCAGCWPQMEPDRLRERVPQIDALMGPGDVPRVVTVVRQALQGAPVEPTLAEQSAFLYDSSTPRLRATPPWTAYVKIAEGCDHRCSFCVIPRLRGRYHSRPLDSIVEEVEALAAQGVREVNLIAQDTTAYGQDLAGADISELLAALAGVQGIRWIRLLYGFPTRVGSRLLEVMSRETKVCAYIDLPFQHADRSILRRMGRPGEGESYLATVEDLRRAMPDIALRSTFLVGFPGEGDREFEQLLAFVEAAQLDRAGAFRYSREQGTRAAEMPDQVSPEVAEARYHELMSLQQGISLARNQGWVGREIEVLVEARGRAPGEWVGRSFRDAPEVDGSVFVRAPRRPLRLGRYVRARVVKAEPYDLVAEVLSPGRRRPPASRV
jgi:ribosomal protein S12 methylthiotransferase